MDLEHKRMGEYVRKFDQENNTTDLIDRNFGNSEIDTTTENSDHFIFDISVKSEDLILPPNEYFTTVLSDFFEYRNKILVREKYGMLNVPPHAFEETSISEFYYSDVETGIKTSQIIDGPEIFPNPVKQILNLKNFDEKGVYEILSGNLIGNEINTEKLLSGIYILKLYSNDSNTTSQFIKH